MGAKYVGIGRPWCFVFSFALWGRQCWWTGCPSLPWHCWDLWNKRFTPWGLGSDLKPGSVGVSRRKLTLLQVLLDGHIFSDSLQHLPFQVPCSCPPAGASLWSPLSMLVQGSSLGNVSSHKIATGRWGEGEDCCFSAHLGPQAPHCAAAATLGSLGWKGQRRASERAPKDREQMLKPQLLSQLRQGFLCLKRGLW